MGRAYKTIKCPIWTPQERWGPEYENTLFGAAAMSWSDGGEVVEDKMLNAVLEQDSFVTAFTGEREA